MYNKTFKPVNYSKYDNYPEPKIVNRNVFKIITITDDTKTDKVKKQIYVNLKQINKIQKKLEKKIDKTMSKTKKILQDDLSTTKNFMMDLINKNNKYNTEPIYGFNAKAKLNFNHTIRSPEYPNVQFYNTGLMSHTHESDNGSGSGSGAGPSNDSGSQTSNESTGSPDDTKNPKIYVQHVTYDVAKIFGLDNSYFQN